MRCPSCAHANRDTAKFCEDCAAPLTQACPRCGTELRPAAKFCDECAAPVAATPRSIGTEREPRSYTPKHLAEKILTSRSALEGERKQVTVLFADVQGSLALSERVDPELLHGIMDRFFTILADGVHRFEGTVNQYTGDGIMALFGAPIAHEDHARRACYAALHLTDELRRYADELRVNTGLNFAVRMGLNSGEVVVGSIGDDLRMDYTAQGHAVGLAARMEQIAEPGRVYLTQHTAGLVEGFFRLRDLGLLAVKGVHGGVRAYELQGVGPLRTRLEVAQARGFSRFVGRSHEMQVLEAALAQALDGHGQVVGVVGEAGVGKSRLCLEFVDQCRARRTPVYETHCPAHGKTLPFFAVLELLRAYFGITERDSETDVRKKIAGTLILLDQSFHAVLPLLFDFLGVADPERPAPRMDPEVRQRQLFALLRQLVERRSARELAVLLIDDVHWIDAGSDGFLAQLVEAVSGTRTLLLVNFRPEYDAPWLERSYYQQLPLLPLTPQGTEELLADLFGCDPSLTGLAERLAERTGGNPFFIEEVVQSLAESGTLDGTKGAYRLAHPVEALAIPATVQVVLASRIDRLVEREKRVLQTAAVIGKQFSEPLLRRVAALSEGELSAALAALTSAEFVYQGALYPVAEYTFRHPLTQEVAYGSQLAERRTRVHAAVARAIQEAYPTRLDEHAAWLAHHWEAAGDALQAARWHRRVVTGSGALIPTVVVHHWGKVRQLLATAPESPEALEMRVAACTGLLYMGWRSGMGEGESRALYEEGKALASRIGDVRALAELTNSFAGLEGIRGNPAAEIEHLGQAMELSEQAGDAGLTAVLHQRLGWAHFTASNLTQAVAATERGLRLAAGNRRLGADISGYSPYIFTVALRALCLAWMARLEEAASELDRAVEMATADQDFFSLGMALLARGVLAWVRGDVAAAKHHVRRGFEQADRLGHETGKVWALEILSSVLIEEEDWPGAVTACEESSEIIQKTGMLPRMKQLSCLYLAEAASALGDHDKARSALAEARQLGQQLQGEPPPSILYREARVVLRVDGARSRETVDTLLERTMTYVRDHSCKSFEPLIHEQRAHLARLTGDATTYQRELRRAHRLFTEMGAPGHAQRLAKELGR